MAADAVAEIKARLDVVEVIGGYLRLQKAGREHTGLCPFHSERSPSFTVSQERQVWYCFGCQEGGDLISFVQKSEHLDFPQALQLLAERAGIELETGAAGDSRAAARKRKRVMELNRRAQAFFEHVLWETPAGDPGRDLLRSRGVNDELAREFGIGFAPAGGASGDALARYLGGKGATEAELVDAGLVHGQRRGGATRDRFRHRLVFPIRDANGQTIAFGGRALASDEKAKYLNSPETVVYHKGSALFGIDRAKAAIPAAEVVVIVEGYFDVMAAHAAGVRNVVASSGTALTSQQVAILGRQATTLVLCFDTDPAGRLATSRAVDRIAEAGISARICIMPPGVKDPDELVRSDPDAFVRLTNDAPSEWQVLLDWALAGHDGEGTEERRVATRLAVDTLQRIPDATTRALYVDQAATRLRVPPSAIADDLRQRRSARDTSSLRTKVVASIPARNDPGGGSEDEPQPHDVPAWEQYLGSVVMQRPFLVHQLVETHGLDLSLLHSAPVRRLLERAMPLAHDESFPIHALGEHDQRLAARLLMRVVPELNDTATAEQLDRALSQNTARVVSARRQAQMGDLEAELRRARDAGRHDEVETLVRRKHELNTELHRLRAG